MPLQSTSISPAVATPDHSRELPTVRWTCLPPWKLLPPRRKDRQTWLHRDIHWLLVRACPWLNLLEPDWTCFSVTGFLTGNWHISYPLPCLPVFQDNIFHLMCFIHKKHSALYHSGFWSGNFYTLFRTQAVSLPQNSLHPEGSLQPCLWLLTQWKVFPNARSAFSNRPKSHWYQPKEGWCSKTSGVWPSSNRIRAQDGGPDCFETACLLVILKASSGNSFESLHLFWKVSDRSAGNPGLPVV